MTEDQNVKSFMWEESNSFQRSLQFFADDLFDSLNKNLKPEITILAVLNDESENQEKIFIEPENSKYGRRWFNNLKELAQQLELTDKHSIGRAYSIEFDEEYVKKQEALYKRGITNRAYISAIKLLMEKYDHYYKKKYFCTPPVLIDGYLIFIVLNLDLKTFDSYYSLNNSEFHNFTKATSLLESIVCEFISSAYKALKEDKDESDRFSEDTLEIKLRAGKLLMYAVSSCGNPLGIHGLFEIINTISSLRYEGKEGIGRLIIAPKDHEKIKMNIELEEPIFLKDYRKVRKFLELSNNENFLICDSYQVYGLGVILNGYNPRDENLFVINFTNHYQWELTHDRKIMMEINYREPNLPQPKINYSKFSSDFKRIFKGAEENKIKSLWEIIMEATNQKHGTMLLISDNAQNEAARLNKQSFGIKPQKIDKSLITLITTIDGAVLLDNNGTCFSIGVILDGIATEKGNSARGARYNSALRYYDFKRKDINCLIVVVSEDGMIDIIPDLKPQIRHLDIRINLDNLVRLKNAEKPDNKKFQEEIEWFYKHKFYLSQEECEKVKVLKKEIEEKFPEDIVRISREIELAPDPEMNDSYFSDNEGFY